MPAVPAGSKVLVTGANGFVAVWLIRNLLEQGFSVRGTIRTASKGDHLREVFKAYGDKLELVIVPDIEAVSFMNHHNSRRLTGRIGWCIRRRGQRRICD